MPRVRLNAKIYREKALKGAIDAYSHLAHFSLGKDSKYYTVTIRAMDDVATDELVDEFKNYALGLTQRCQHTRYKK